MILYILLLLLIIFIISESNVVEQFGGYQLYQSFIPFNWYWNGLPYFNGYANLPWNNSSFGNTTNMSYDLRGDPMMIPRINLPWSNSSLTPIYNGSI